MSMCRGQNGQNEKRRLANYRAGRISRDCMSDESHFSNVIDLLRAEADAIGKTASRLQPSEVDRVVKILANCEGKVVLLGVGKSGIIAQKIAATMTSGPTSGSTR